MRCAERERRFNKPFAMKPFTFLNSLLLALYLFSVAVQYNDPDPWLWMTIYGLAAGACGLAWRQPAHWLWPGALALTTAGWAATIAPRVLGRVAFGELFEAWEMKDMRVEEARELGGLLIVASWMLVLFLRAYNKWLTQRRAAPQN
jgi:hypothetical protein